ncbi:MAG: OmpH family outer membrane protein [Tenuifilaceae bacterium]|jgi:outer membrane protein|nr:OmpH family outer membrane protein [Bacteroidales bacterium]MDI9515471.1 OmpH family outer membrane protein [Bacteroidota bacterium]NLH57391.1 OmpH family outer membrane protein [Rikenellaceae bacterium]OQC63658.1 MAG: Outer membrane protein (OmpH-like) [Bacteroidetes bacterium ADurb.Bin008]HNV81172.1 OmpH family outer membrane protein [Tenuifilaceae bacterium]
MKRALLVIVLVVTAIGANAQKFAYVDTEYILSRIPTYKAAQDQLDKIARQFQTEIEEKYQEVEQLVKDYESEKILLTEEMKKKREENIIAKEKIAKDLQMKYFGRDGMLFKKREELVKPIQDQIFNVIKELATEGGYAVIFDSAGSANMLYTNPRYDKSDEVLQKLGYN